MDNINQDKEELDLVAQALDMFDNFMDESGKNIKDSLQLLFPKHNKRTLQNNYAHLKNGERIKFAKSMIKAIHRYKENNQDISFNHLNEFFISKNVCKEINEDDKELQGLYLLFRYNIDGKIVVSYMKVWFDGKSLMFKSERNNINTSEDVVSIHISTEGVVIKNKDALYLFIGISRNVNDTAMSFVETLKIAKNDSGSSLPNTGYFHGILAPGKSNDPFISKIVLIKIKNQESKALIENDLSFIEKEKHEIIKTHTVEDLSEQTNLVNKIVSIESKNEKGSEIYRIGNILERLELKITNNFFILNKF